MLSGGAPQALLQGLFSQLWVSKALLQDQGQQGRCSQQMLQVPSSGGLCLEPLFKTHLRVLAFFSSPFCLTSCGWIPPTQKEALQICHGLAHGTGLLGPSSPSCCLLLLARHRCEQWKETGETTYHCKTPTLTVVKPFSPAAAG